MSSFAPDESYMRRAIALALKGGGKAHPNPLVGAVLVKAGRVLGEGFHREYGDLHAEREALRDAQERGEDVRGATLYVTLEPCCHWGKQPPCTDAIIEAGVAVVVAGSADPNPLVDGKGFAALQEAGILVVQGFLKQECDALNEVFFHYIQTGKPFVALKYAQTADGKAALSTGASRWITSHEARDYVHVLRGTFSCVMCGIGTVLADDPLLTCRVQGEGLRQPVRALLDSSLRLPTSSKLVKTAHEVETLVFTDSEGSLAKERKRRTLEAAGVRVIDVAAQEGKLDLEAILAHLGKLGIDSVLVEGGGAINASFLLWGEEKKPLAARIYCFVAPKIFGGKAGQVQSPVQGRECDTILECVKLSSPKVRAFGEDVLLEYKVLAN